MITFVEHMVGYLNGVAQTDDGMVCWIEARGKKGFRARLGRYSLSVDAYKKSGSDVLLVELLKEEFILSGIVEDERIERMRENLKRAEKSRFAWEDEDKRKEKV